MPSEKSNEQAALYQELAVELLNSSKFYDALVAFNRSLCLAFPGSLEMSLSFEGRSELFYKVGQFEKCLRNIQAAREHHLPPDKTFICDEREKLCYKRLGEKLPCDELANLFKLSYPANEKIPFIADCLSICECEQFGRYIVATHDLKPGDVIATEETPFNFISSSSIFTRCFNCLKSNMLDLNPSSASVMFCSEKCSIETYRKFSEKDDLIRDSLCGNDIRQKMSRIISNALISAGGFDELQRIFSNLTRETVFDFDFSGSNEIENRRNLLIAATSLLPKTDCGIASYLESIITIPDSTKKSLMVNFTTRLILNYMRNGAKLPGKGTDLRDGGLLLPFVSLFNHSCDPNTYASFNDNKCVITVIQPIKADEQIYISYRKSFMGQTKDIRQAELLKTYEFTCECIACANNYPMPNKLRRYHPSFVLPAFGRFGNDHEIVEELKQRYKFMEDNINQHPCFETAACLMRIKELIRTASERVSYPFESVEPIVL